jgi:L-threonylcarbamoyladenylate synthase
MDTIRINPIQPEPALLKQAAKIARDGTPFVLPTDTVYGMGMAVGEGRSPHSLFSLKGRDPDKAIPWLVADASALSTYGEDVPSYAFELARAHWPGALTLVVRANASVPAAFRAQDGSIALRAPAHPIPLALIEALGVPLATTSANLQGEQPATSFAALDPRLLARIALCIDGGQTPGSVPSTIISCLDEHPHILRKGAVCTLRSNDV